MMDDIVNGRRGIGGIIGDPGGGGGGGDPTDPPGSSGPGQPPTRPPAPPPGYRPPPGTPGPPGPPTRPPAFPPGTRPGRTAVPLIKAFANVIMYYDDTYEYSSQAMECAAYVKRPVVSTTTPPVRPPAYPPDPISRPPARPPAPRPVSGISIALRAAMPPASEGAYYPQISVNEPQVTDVDATQANLGSRARVNLFAFMEEVSAFASQAKNAGFLPPSNPFVEIGRLNAFRPIVIDGPNNGQPDIEVTEQQASDILFNIQVYVDLLEAQKAGAINLKTGVFNTAQLEHVSLSYIGLGSSGNPAVDLLALLPNADQIKKKKADEALAILNFNRRQPHVIFVADYSPNQDDGTQGAMICWKNMPDASGFVINRHGIFDNSDVSFNLSMQQVKNNNRAYLDYAKAYVLTFYDQINPNNVSLFVDSNIPPDDYFIYTVQAYQNSKASSTSLIPSNYIAIHLNNQQKQMILDELSFDNNDVVPNVSPWPVIAKQLFGDDSMDWILAATNIRASIDRGDPIADVRSYSYLAANVNYIFTQSDAGKLVKPTNSDDLSNSINDALTTYGVLQTIESLLQESGILYYFDGVDPNSENTFKRAGTLDYSDSSLFAAVASAMDPENATVNLKMLTTNLAVVLNNPQVQSYLANPAWNPQGNSKPSEITIVHPDVTTQTISDSGIQFLNILSTLADSTVDLTTFDGISQLIRVIRLMSDYSPNRAKQIVPPLPPAVSITPPSGVVTIPENNMDNTLLFAQSLVEEARNAGKGILADRIQQIILLQKEMASNKTM